MRRSPFIVIALLTAVVGIASQSRAFAEEALDLVCQWVLAAPDSDPFTSTINPYTADGVRTTNLIGGTMGILIDTSLAALPTPAAAIETNLTDGLPPADPKTLFGTRPHHDVAMLDGSLKPATLRLADDQWGAFWPAAPSVMPTPTDDSWLSSDNRPASFILGAGES